MASTENNRPMGSGAVRDKARAFIKESWQSQANLAFFLALLVAMGLVLPSLGFGKNDELRYSNFSFSLLLLSGVAIAYALKRIALKEPLATGKREINLDAILDPSYETNASERERVRKDFLSRIGL